MDQLISKIESLIIEWETVKSSSEHAILTWETEALKTIFPYRFDNVEIILKDMIQVLTKNDKFWCPGSSDPNYFKYFSKTEFNSFMDYFTRELSPNKSKDILLASKTSAMIIPNECYIESIGTLLDTHKILSLKKPATDVIDAMGKLKLDINGYSYINQKLLLTFYHRIHSPVNGTIQQIIPVSKDEKIFGDNALWIVDINTAYGPVYFMLVGESEIQDFTFKVKTGDFISKFTEIGNFNWGSQTIIFYNADKFGDINIKEGSHYFVGDKIY